MDRYSVSLVAASAVKRSTQSVRSGRAAANRRVGVDPSPAAPTPASQQAAQLRVRALARDNARLRAELARLGEVVAQVEQLAYHDELTGLPNRTLMMDRMNQAIAQSSRDGLRVAVLVLDLDRFKEVNDSLGHAAGDRLLCEVARRLSAAVREADTVARYGGDEFVLMLPRVRDGHSVGRVVRMLRDRLAAPMLIDGTSVTVGASVGIAIHPCDGDAPEDLLAKADARMYRDKERLAGSGRARAARSERPDDQQHRQADRNDQHLERQAQAPVVPEAQSARAQDEGVVLVPDRREECA